MNNHKKLLSQIFILVVLAIIVSIVGSASKAWADASTTRERILFLKEKRTLNENKLRTLKAKREQLLLLINAAKAKEEKKIEKRTTVPTIEVPPKIATTTATTSSTIMKIEIPPIKPPVVPTLPPVQIKTTTTNTTNTNTSTQNTSNTTNTTSGTQTSTKTSTTQTTTTTTNPPTTSTVSTPTTSLFGSSLTGMTQSLIKPTVSASVVSITIKDKPAKKITYTMSYSAPVSYFTVDIKCDSFVEAYRYDSNQSLGTSNICGSKIKFTPTGTNPEVLTVGYLNTDTSTTNRQATITLQAFNLSDQSVGVTTSQGNYIPNK
jgi:hypothetical protein